MLGRLFNLLLFVGLSALLARMLLKPTQKVALHRLFQTVAWALLASAALLVTLTLTHIITP